MSDGLTNDRELVAAFEAGTLPQNRWNHITHIRVAFLYLHQHGVAEAIDRMRAGLQALNAAHGTPNRLARGYHESVTVAFMRIVNAALQMDHSETSEEFCQRNPQLLDKGVLRRHYSWDRLMSAKAKVSFIEPDLAPLPD